MAIVGPKAVAQYDYLYITTTRTYRDEDVDVSSVGGDFVIDQRGSVYQNRTPTPGQAHVVLVGGIDTYTHAKDPMAPIFYMTERQKITLYAIMRELSIRTDAAQITSSDQVLEQIAKSTYVNYVG